MSYLLIKVHSFECDHAGCNAEQEHAEPTLRLAEQLIMKDHWQIIRRPYHVTIHYCPRHGVA